MRLTLPGPSDLVDAVRDVAAAVNALAHAASGAVALVPRTLDDLDETALSARGLVGRAGPLVDDIGTTLRRVDDVVVRAESAIGRVDAIAAGAQDAIERVDAIASGAQTTVTRIEAIASGR